VKAGRKPADKSAISLLRKFLNSGRSSLLKTVMIAFLVLKLPEDLAFYRNYLGDPMNGASSVGMAVVPKVKQVKS
jgi:hypothetical protein